MTYNLVANNLFKKIYNAEGFTLLYKGLTEILTEKVKTVTGRTQKQLLNNTT